MARAPAQFWRFCLVGLLGLVIDAGALLALLHTGLNAYQARFLSIIIAVSATWACHRHYTFKSSDPNRAAEWFRFVLVNGAGATANYAVYAALIWSWPGMPPLAALALASALALAVNFTGARLFAFRGATV